MEKPFGHRSHQGGVVLILLPAAPFHPFHPFLPFLLLSLALFLPIFYPWSITISRLTKIQ